MKKLSNQELKQAVQTLGLLVRRNYPLSDAVKALGQGREPWVEVGRHVAEGDELGPALRRYPQIFSPFFSGMVEAAERSHNAGAILTTLSTWLETADRMRRKVQEVLYYPIILISFLLMELGLLLGFGLGSTVLPLKYVNEGPLSSDLASAIQLGSIVCFILAAIVLFGSWKVESLIPVALRIPAFRAIVQRADQAVWARALAAFLQAGTPLPDALERCQSVPWSKELRLELEKLALRIKKGDTLSKALSETDILDPQLRWAVTAGESREDLSATLLYSAEQLERGLMERCEAFMLILQPLTVLLVGAMTAALLAPFWWSFYHYSWNLGLPV